MEIDDKAVLSTSKVKLYGITIDLRLNFDAHVKSLCVKPNRSVSDFSRFAGYLQQPQRKLLYNSLIMSNFKYRP